MTPDKDANVIEMLREECSKVSGRSLAKSFIVTALSLSRHANHTLREHKPCSDPKPDPNCVSDPNPNLDPDPEPVTEPALTLTLALTLILTLAMTMA